MSDTNQYVGCFILNTSESSFQQFWVIKRVFVTKYCKASKRQLWFTVESMNNKYIWQFYENLVLRTCLLHLHLNLFIRYILPKGILYLWTLLCLSANSVKILKFHNKSTRDSSKAFASHIPSSHVNNEKI